MLHTIVACDSGFEVPNFHDLRGLIHHYVDFDLSLRREAHLGEIVQWILGGRHQLVDFGVERHTLVTGKITQVFHHSSAVVTQVPASRAHLFRVRVQVLRRFSGLTCLFQGEFIDSPPTQIERKARSIFFLVPR
jgi:hypothetical protein